MTISNCVTLKRGAEKMFEMMILHGPFSNSKPDTRIPHQENFGELQ